MLRPRSTARWRWSVWRAPRARLPGAVLLHHGAARRLGSGALRRRQCVPRRHAAHARRRAGRRCRSTGARGTRCAWRRRRTSRSSARPASTDGQRRRARGAGPPARAGAAPAWSARSTGRSSSRCTRRAARGRCCAQGSRGGAWLAVGAGTGRRGRRSRPSRPGRRAWRRPGRLRRDLLVDFVQQVVAGAGAAGRLDRWH